MRKEFDSVRYADGFCSWNVALLVTIMVIGWSSVEPLGSVVLEFFVRRGVDDVNGDMTCWAGR